MDIHQSTHSEAAELVAVLNDALAHKHSKSDSAWGQHPFNEEEISGAITTKERYTITLNGTVCGTFVLQERDERWPRDDKRALYIHQFAMNESARGQGLGKEVMQWINEQARVRHLDLLRLDYLAENKGLEAYYESHGFRFVRSVTADIFDIPTVMNLCQKEVDSVGQHKR